MSGVLPDAGAESEETANASNTPLPRLAGENGVAKALETTNSAKPVLGYVPGAWDMFHVGHLNILLRARDQCDRLIVGVVSDEALLLAKGKRPVVPLAERMEVVRAMDMVDDVVVDYSSNKIEVWQRVGFDVLFKGDDWLGTPKGDRLVSDMASVGVRVNFFPYTAHTSSTLLRSRLAGRNFT